MVTESLIGVLSGVFTWLLGWIPAPDVPAFFDDASSGIQSISELLGSVSVWIPVGLVALVLAAWAATWATGVLIKLARIVLSLFTAGGGSAA